MRDAVKAAEIPDGSGQPLTNVRGGVAFADEPAQIEPIQQRRHVEQIELRGRRVLPVECIQEQARRSGIARGDRPLFQRKRGAILNRREQIVTELQAHDVPSLLDGR